MRNRAIIFSAVLVLATAVLGTWVILNRAAPRIAGPLTQEAYVWQRAWIEPVRKAVTLYASHFSSLTVLGAEISWKDRKPLVTRVAADYPTLARAGRPVGLALRIGPYPGPFAENDPTTTLLADTAASLVADARSNQINPCELQIDFDCAESKLGGYRVWLDAIQRRVAPVPVTITALPSWLKSPAFKPLAALATNYVLQVHSLERPTDLHAPFTLCDPRGALRAIERAGRIGVPFRVALPTYGYVVAFDRSGKFIGLSAEGPSRAWSDGVQLREVNADPQEMAALVQALAASRPAALRGVIWYRFPVAVDNLNWRWPTLSAVMSARSPRQSLRVEPRRVEAGLVEITLVNDGDLDISTRLAVEVRWSSGSGSRVVAGDGLHDFEMADTSASAARFQTRSQSSRLAAGEKMIIGWIRFNRDCEVHVEVKKL